MKRAFLGITLLMVILSFTEYTSAFAMSEYPNTMPTCHCKHSIEREIACTNEQGCQQTQMNSWCQGDTSCDVCMISGFGLCCDTQFTVTSICGLCGDEECDNGARVLSPILRARMLVPNCRGAYSLLNDNPSQS